MLRSDKRELEEKNKFVGLLQGAAYWPGQIQYYALNYFNVDVANA